jgi:hypothetical protein
MTARSAPTFVHRVKAAGAFLAIVWGVAATFILFDQLVIGIGGRLAESGFLPAAVEHSRVCVASPPGPDAPQPVSPDVLSGAWMLGMRTGLHARAALMVAENERTATPQTRERVAATRRMIDAVAADIAQRAAALRVPPPPSFVPTNVAMENVDFPPFIEGDGNQTAKALTASYGTEACQVFQMGAYWGHSALVRTALPGQANIHAAEIGHYARLLRLPESLWRPLVERTPADATGETLATEVDRATAAVTTHFQAGDRSSGAERK